jgi:hypothetical protein
MTTRWALRIHPSSSRGFRATWAIPLTKRWSPRSMPVAARRFAPFDVEVLLTLGSVGSLLPAGVRYRAPRAYPDRTSTG